MSENVLFEKYGQTVPAGAEIFREGEQGSRMFIIQKGSVRITKEFDGRPHVLAELGKGDFFGEMAIVSRMERTATATAVTETQILCFDRKGFESMIEKNAQIAMNVIDKLCRRLAEANAQIQHFFRKNEESLVALDLYNRFIAKPEGEPVLARDRVVREISLNLEIPAETVQQVIDELARRDILTVKQNALRLKNAGRLGAVVEKGGADTNAGETT
ncbi:MAG: Crp/Fnr family transcriptional regulator [Spirochaetaceae bacterium]